MLTRKQIIDCIEAIDAEIDALQQSKRETYDDHRHNLVAADGKEVAKAEIDGLKKAIQRRRQVSKHGVEVIEQRDALVEEILAEVANAPRATRASSVPTESGMVPAAEAGPDLGNATASASHSAPTGPPEDAADVGEGQAPQSLPELYEPEQGTVSSGDFQREPASVPLVSDPLPDADAQRLTAGPLSPPGDAAEGTGGVHRPLVPTTDYVVFFDADADARCRKPEMCGSHSRLAVCGACQAAWDAEHQFAEAAE